eukprot:5463646-Pyramimonas_sp.AAC.1
MRVSSLSLVSRSVLISSVWRRWRAWSASIASRSCSTSDWVYASCGMNRKRNRRHRGQADDFAEMIGTRTRGGAGVCVA